MEDPAMREVADYMEANRDEIFEKLPNNRPVTLLVLKEGDIFNFFRVVDRGDGTMTPLSESLRYDFSNFFSVKTTYCRTRRPSVVCENNLFSGQLDT